MILNKYDDLSDFVSNLVSLSVLNEKDVNLFLKESADDEINTFFHDDEEGLFHCYMWIKNLKTLEEYKIIESISNAWAYYCGIDNADVLINLKTCSGLSYSIIKGLKDGSG